MRVQGVLLIVAAVSSFACHHGSNSEESGGATPGNAVKIEAPAGAYVPVATYDIKRDPQADLELAMAEAKRTSKRILLEVGGEWCSWCHIMDAYFESHPDLLAYREQKFVTVKVNYSEENKNEKFLSGYPKINGYPHIFVLESDGKVLHSQNTGELEEGKSYNLARFDEFLKKYALQMKGAGCH